MHLPEVLSEEQERAHIIRILDMLIEWHRLSDQLVQKAAVLRPLVRDEIWRLSQLQKPSVPVTKKGC